MQARLVVDEKRYKKNLGLLSSRSCVLYWNVDC